MKKGLLILCFIMIFTDAFSQRIPFGFWNRGERDTVLLAVPELKSPSDSAVGVDQSPNLNWDGVIYATRYVVQLSPDTGFSTITWEHDTSSSRAGVTLGLARGSQWYWRVLAYNAFDTSDWSQAWTFTVTTGAPLTAPVLKLPEDGTTTTTQSPTLVWDAVINADTYVIELSDSTDFSSPYWIKNTENTSAIIDSVLDYSSTWYWRATAYNDFDTSNASDTFSFSILSSPLTAPTLLTPTNGATGQTQSPALVWSRVDSAGFYSVQISQSEIFADIPWSINTFDTTQTIATVLEEGTKWYWRVRSINSDTSAWSTTFSFAVTEGTQIARAYYIDATSGADEYSGRETSKAWKTISKINSRTLIPGDTILFKSGETFSGATLRIKQSGTITDPIIISSFGGTKATILAQPDSSAIYTDSKEYITIRSLKLKGVFDPFNQGGASQKSDAGIYVNNVTIGKLNGITIDSCSISNFNGLGIFFRNYNSDTSYKGGYNNIVISNSSIDSIGHLGIYFVWNKSLNSGSQWYPFDNYPNQNINIRNVRIQRVTGILTYGTYTGTGILLSDVDTATVERCVISNCGTTPIGYGAGPGGFDAVRSNALTVQYCEVYNQQTGGNDGNGIHFDAGVSNSIIQYNYVHNNEGTGISLYSTTSGSSPIFPRLDSNNVVRYNILEKNGWGGSSYNGDLSLRGGSDTLYNISAYNNTIYSYSNHSDTVTSGIVLSGTTNTINLWNNIIVTGDTLTRLADITGTQINLQMQGNLYWNINNRFKLRDNNTYYGYNTWQAAKSRELLSSVNVGYFGNPLLLNAGSGGNLDNAYMLDTMTAYQTYGASLSKERGINIDSLYSIDPGSRDFYGNVLRQNNKYDAGAFENPDSYIWQDSTKLYISQSITPPSESRQYIYDSLYIILQRDSLLRSTRALYIYAAHDTTLALRSLKIDSTVSTRKGTMTFMPDTGFYGDGSTGVIRTNFTIGTLLTQNSTGYGIYILNDIAEEKTDISCYGASNYIYLRSRRPTNNYYAINTTGLLQTSVSSSAGYWNSYRNASDSISLYNGKDLIVKSASTSSGLPAGQFTVGGVTYNGGTTYAENSTKKYSAVWVGTGMSTYRAGKMTEAIDWWMRRMNISVLLPHTTTLLSPENGADSVSITPTLNWDSIVNASSYHIQLSFEESFSALVGEITGLTNSEYIVGGINPGAVGSVTLDTNETVYWRVRGIGTTGTGNWSSTFSFNTHSTLELETIDLLARFPNGVASDERKYVIDSLIKFLKSDTIWSKLDVLYLFAAGDTGQANQNWIADSNTCVTLASKRPTFTQDRGYTGNGTNQFVNTHWTPLYSVNYKQDTACYGVFIRTNVAESGFGFGAQYSGANLVRFNPRNASNISTYSINENSGPTVSNSDSRGMFSINRSTTNAIQYYRNGVSIATATGTTSGRTQVPVYICALNNSSSIGAGEFSLSTREYSAFFAGTSMSAYTQWQFYRRIEWYLNRVGAFPLVPSAPIQLLPLDAATGVDATPLFDWDNVGADYYQIEIDDFIAFSTPEVSEDVSGSEFLSDIDPLLTANTTYYWRVRGVNAYGTGAWSSTFSFTTAP